jgi:hypothetical protein
MYGIRPKTTRLSPSHHLFLMNLHIDFLRGGVSRYTYNFPTFFFLFKSLARNFFFFFF